MPGLLVIIPALNEREALPRVLRSLQEYAGNPDVLVVDDGSTDGTADVARAHGATVAVLPFNLGVGAALRTGFRYATMAGYDRAIQVDADGQHDARELAKLTDRLDAGADLVIGTRFAGATAGEYRVAGVRGLAMSVMRITVKALLGSKFSDTSSGFRGFSRPMLDYFSTNYPREYMSDTVEALVVAAYRGFRIEEVAVRMHVRSGGIPSTRSLRLVFHYLRLLSVLVVTVSLRGRRTTRIGDVA
jgi:glycosyltransferase involved in cell wall biosynthesis